MARIITIGDPGDEIPTTPLAISGLETDAEMDLKLALQHAELEHGIAERIAGIGSPRANAVWASVLRYRRARKIMENRKLHPRQKHVHLAGLANEAVAGIGKAKKKGPVKTKKRTGRAKRQGNFFKKLGKGLKKGLKSGLKLALNVATFPQRIAIKALGEVMLPKMSMMFLYLFVTNKQTIAQLPAPVQRKRRKAVKFAKFMTKTIGMKESHFMKLIRNGIMKKAKQTPEQLLSQHIKGSLSGVGDIGFVQFIPLILQAIEMISKAFGKKPSADEKPTKDDVPDLLADFASATPKAKRKVLTHLKNKPMSQQGFPAATAEEEAREQRMEDTATQQVEDEPEETPVDAPLPEPEPEESTDESVQAQAEQEEASEAEPAPSDEYAGDEPQF